MNLVSPNGVSSVDWVQESQGTQSRSQLKWYKVREQLLVYIIRYELFIQYNSLFSCVFLFSRHSLHFTFLYLGCKTCSFKT